MAPKTVLIADDDRDLVRVLQMRFRQLDVQVVVAYDALSALQLAHQERPDLVCLDVGMPGGSGLSVCEMLTADKELSSIPTIMLTGRADEQTIRRCHEMCAYYVLKSEDVWGRMEPIARELLGMIPVPSVDTRTFAPERHGRGLSSLCKVLAQQAQANTPEDRETVLL